MSIRQILKSREIVCVVPDARKADAVKATIEGDDLASRARLDPAHAPERHRYTSIATRRHGSRPAIRGPILEDDAA